MNVSTPRRGFTLIELLVVVTIIVVLLALLVPALDKAIEQTERAVCATNQHVISTAAVQYGLQNRKELFICRGREVMYAIDPLGSNAHAARPSDAQVDWPAAMATVGLASQDKAVLPPDPYSGQPGAPGYANNTPGKMWNCPGRDWESYWAFNALYGANGSPELSTMFIGYMYYGGMARWRNTHLRGGVNNNPPTPKRLSDPGDRTLVSDVIPRVNGVWGGGDGRANAEGGTPAHTDGDVRPAGSNHAFLDGSVQWIDGDKLMMLCTWNDNGNVQRYFFWQRDVGGWDYGDRTTDPFWMSANK